MKKIFETLKRRETCWLVFLLIFVILIAYLQTDRRNLQMDNEKLQTEKKQLQADKEELEQVNADYREYMLEESKLIELKAETDNSSNDLPTVTLVKGNLETGQLMCGDYVDSVTHGSTLLYYSDADKVRLHFKMEAPKLYYQSIDGFKEFKNWTLTCEDPDGKDVQVEKDELNPNYYYINLEKKGNYLFNQKYGKGGNSYFWLTW